MKKRKETRSAEEKWSFDVSSVHVNWHRKRSALLARRKPQLCQGLFVRVVVDALRSSDCDCACDLPYTCELGLESIFLLFQCSNYGLDFVINLRLISFLFLENSDLNLHGGGMENNDDDYFSDDFDFDSLPPGTLYELERNAYQATQPSATQHDNARLDPNAHVDFHGQAGQTIQQPANLKQPIQRLHSGLTNEYDTLEVGELEAEVHDNVGGQLALPPDHQVMAPGGGLPVNGGIGDIMDVDNYPQGNSYELNIHMEQVNRKFPEIPSGL